jgi:outer membrane protein
MKFLSRMPVLSVAAVVAALIISVCGLVAKPELKKIGLEEAISLAKKNNYDCKIARHKQKADAEKVNEAWGMLYPTLESQASLSRQGADSGFLSLTDGQYDIKIVQVRFGLNPGAFYNTLQMSRKGYIVSTEEVRRVTSEIEYNVIESYFNLILAEEMISLRNDNIKFFKENLKDVENMYKTGSVPRYDLLQAQVQLKSEEPLLLEAENQRRLALDMLNYQMGFDSEVYTADGGILKNDDYRIAENDIDSFVARVGGIALKNRPEVVQLRMKKEIEAHQAGIARSYYLWPTLSVGGFYGYNKGLPNVSKAFLPTQSGGLGYMDLSRIAGNGAWQPNWQVQIAATYRWGSLIPVDPTRAQEREAKIMMDEAQEELNRFKRLLTISLKSSYSNLLTSYQTIFSHKENVEKALEGLRIARESFRQGVIKNSDLLAAQVQLVQARTGYINAINTYYQSLAKLRKDIGVDNDSVIFRSGGRDHE